MQKWIIFLSVTALVFGPGCAQKRETDLTVKNLRCEYLGNPLGIDVTRPRLSWVLESAKRGQTQTAYRILVASSKENLEKDTGDLWDSGKVESDRSIQVVYKGTPLKSHAVWLKS